MFLSNSSQFFMYTSFTLSLLFLRQKLNKNLLKPSLLTFLKVILTNHRQSISSNYLASIIINMIRNRLPQLYQAKRNLQRLPVQPARIHQGPIWEGEYYHFKSQLCDLAATNREIQQLVNQYSHDPTVYSLQILERLIDTNCKRLNQIQSWVARFSYSSGPTDAVTLERNLVRYFQSEILAHINTLFALRRKLNDIVEQKERQRPYNSINQSRDFSFTSVNQSFNDRGQSIKEVGRQIEGLQNLLRKMGDIVTQQGDLLNRIDENMRTGLSSVKKGKEQLQQRVGYESGEEEEFSCSGRINKTIVTLYTINVILILILVFKHL